MARTKYNSGLSRDNDFKPTHRVIASRGMSIPAILIRHEGPVAHFIDETGQAMKCHRSEIIPLVSE